VRGGLLTFLTNWYERRKKTHQLSRNRGENDELNILTESWILAGSRLQRIGQVSQPKEGVTVDFASRRSANDDHQFDDVFVKLETRTLNNQLLCQTRVLEICNKWLSLIIASLPMEAYKCWVTGYFGYTPRRYWPTCSPRLMRYRFIKASTYFTVVVTWNDNGQWLPLLTRFID